MRGRQLGILLFFAAALAGGSSCSSSKSTADQRAEVRAVGRESIQIGVPGMNASGNTTIPAPPAAVTCPTADLVNDFLNDKDLREQRWRTTPPPT